MSRRSRQQGMFPLGLLVSLSVISRNALAQSQTGFAYNGMVRAVYSNNDLGTSADNTYAEFVQGTGGNYVAITIEWFVATPSSTTIAANSGDSATDAQIITEIQKYHNLGLKVVLKPQVDVINYTSWRGELDPTSVSAWFTSYQAYMTHYAQIAQQCGVDGFSVGTELKSLSGSQNLSYWQTVIAAVRADYTGPIMYGANATGAGDEFTTVSFWSLVDIIGVDGYFGLTGVHNPTLAQLEAAWTDSSSPYTGSGFNAVAALKNLNSAYNKPVVFTEVGYVSSAGTNEEPYASLSNGYDPTEQENCYSAFFNVFSQQSSWMKGVFWWALSLPLPGTDDQGYVPYSKPTGNYILPLWYNGTKLASATALTASPNPASAGQTVTLTADVSRTGSGVTGTPGGMVNFYYQTLFLGSGTVNASGVASYTQSTTGIAAGTYAITANYMGDSSDLASSGSYTVTLNKIATATALTITPNFLPANYSTSLQATVTRTTGTGTPGGSVTFYYGSQSLGTAQLSGGIATLSASDSGVPAGNYNITATYNGDSTDASSTSAAEQVTVQ